MSDTVALTISYLEVLYVNNNQTKIAGITMAWGKQPGYATQELRLLHVGEPVFLVKVVH